MFSSYIYKYKTANIISKTLYVIPQKRPVTVSRLLLWIISLYTWPIQKTSEYFTPMIENSYDPNLIWQQHKILKKENSHNISRRNSIVSKFGQINKIKAEKLQLYKTERRRARPGFEPGTSRTLSENHTPRPTSRRQTLNPFLKQQFRVNFFREKCKKWNPENIIKVNKWSSFKVGYATVP